MVSLNKSMTHKDQPGPHSLAPLLRIIARSEFHVCGWRFLVVQYLSMRCSVGKDHKGPSQSGEVWPLTGRSYCLLMHSKEAELIFFIALRRHIEKSYLFGRQE